MEKLHNDLAAALDMILQSRFPDPGQFQQIYDIYPAAMDAADAQMEEADALPLMGLLEGAASLRSVGLAVSAQQLHNELLELDDLLREAQDEEVETEIKSLLGVAITSVELMVPGLGLLARGGLTAFEIVSDYSNPKTVARQGLKYGLESVEEVESAGEVVKRFSKRGGKFVTVTGFYFDVDEVLSAKKNVKKIKALLEKARKEYKELTSRLGDSSKSLVAFQNHLDIVMRPMRDEIWAKTRERDDLISKYQYSIVTPIQWRIVDDYTRYQTASGH